jgi:hypothetical protein
MKINKTYRSLLDKSINSMLSAIEIYNKPNFSYREETFAILAVNAWELILKAHLLKCCNYNMRDLYHLEPKTKADGTKSKLKQPKLNRTGNPTTIGIFEVICRLEVNKIKLSDNLIDSIESLIELRDNAIHFHNEKQISKELQELGFACIKNYMNFIKIHDIDIDLSNYNFYLMPLAYVDSKIEVESIMTDEVKKYLEFVKNKVSNSDNEDEYTIAISIDISFNKSNSFDGINFKYGADGVAITINEEDIRTKYPLTHSDMIEKAKKRYSNFIRNPEFHKVMRDLKKNKALFHERKLDPDNPKSQKKPFYNSNIWKELDKFYKKITD